MCVTSLGGGHESRPRGILTVNVLYYVYVMLHVALVPDWAPHIWHTCLLASLFPWIFSGRHFLYPCFNAEDSAVKRNDRKIGNFGIIMVFKLSMKSLAICWSEIWLSFTWPDSMVCSRIYRPPWSVLFNPVGFRLYEYGWHVFLIYTWIRWFIIKVMIMFIGFYK